MTPLDALFWALGAGSSAAGVTAAVRALPWVHTWMLERRKPWACDVCMGFWTTALMVTGICLWQTDGHLFFVFGPAYPFSLWVLRKTGEPSGPPVLPELDSME